MLRHAYWSDNPITVKNYSVFAKYNQARDFLAVTYSRKLYKKLARNG